MFSNAENEIRRITKETNYIEIHLSNVKKNVICCGLFPRFLVEGNAKFQLEVSGNKNVICFPIQVHGPLEIYPRTPG
jgi:hypothetical protein